MAENTKEAIDSQIGIAATKFARVLSEARRRIMLTLIVFFVVAFLGFIYYEQIIKILIGSLNLYGVNIVFTSPFQFINLAISTGIGSGLIAAFPLLVVQILFFLKPALREREYKMLIRLLPFSFILFGVGFAFGVYIMRWQIDIFADKSVSLGIGNVLDISNLLTVVILTALLMGFSFQFPIFLLLFLRLGLLKHERLASFRYWVYFGSFIFAIFLPPDSILADILLALPLALLFELTLLIDKAYNKKSKKITA